MPSSNPRPDEAARVLELCRQATLPWRCTATGCGVKLGGAAYVKRAESDPTICVNCEKERDA